MVDILVIIGCAVAVIAHQEWRYRRLIVWIDSLAEMVSDDIETRRNRHCQQK